MLDRLFWALTALSAVTGLATCHAQTIYVDGSYPGCPGSGSQADPFCSIQDAIQAAPNGALILVLPGVYYENIDFLGKAITVLGEQGWQNTILDGGQNPIATVTFQNEESQSSIIEGFTIRNGRGGISCFQASPTIQKNRIVNNLFLSGVRCLSGSPVIRGNTISNNTGTIGNAGGIYCAASSAFISNNVITENVGRYGGGVSCRSGQPTITSNQILDNSTTDLGGGGVFLRTSQATVINNEIARNSASVGGGVYSWGTPSSTLVNNTITENTGTTLAGGLYSRDAQTVVQNTILWNNGANAVVRQSGALQISYSDVQGGYPGNGNLSSDPKFVDPPSGDYRLACDSPCVEAGNPNPGVSLPAFDNSGRDDRVIGRIDIGADELGTLWSLAGAPVPGGPPVHFEARTTPALFGDLSEVYLSLASSYGQDDGLLVPGAGGRRLFLVNDVLFNVWITFPYPLRQVSLTGCPPASTLAFSVPPNITPGLEIFFAGVTWDLSTGQVVSVPLPQSFLIQ